MRPTTHNASHSPDESSGPSLAGASPSPSPSTASKKDETITRLVRFFKDSAEVEWLSLSSLYEHPMYNDTFRPDWPSFEIALSNKFRSLDERDLTYALRQTQAKEVYVRGYRIRVEEHDVLCDFILESSGPRHFPEVTNWRYSSRWNELRPPAARTEIPAGDHGENQAEPNARLDSGVGE